MRALLYASLRCPRLGLQPVRWLLPDSRHATLVRRCAHTRSTSAVAVADHPTESPSEYDPSDLYDPTRERIESNLPQHRAEPEVHPPPPSAQEYPAAWTASVESYLPLRLQTAHPRWPLPQRPSTVDIEGLPTLVLLAKTTSDVDILANYALQEGRWEAMLWLADAILHVAKTRYTPNQDRAILQSTQWPKRVFLDDWTDSTASMKEHKIERSQNSRQATLSLDGYTFARSSTSRIVPNRTVHKQLGTLWETIGELILTASSQSETDSRKTMRYTLRLLGQLHYHGFIPSKVYNDPPTHEAPGVRQPSLLSEISPAIMSALLDASMDLGIDQNASEASDPFVKPDIGPGLWMEFVLWCCVRGGWLIEASKILDNMRRKKGSDTWHLVCWQQLESSPESTLADLVQRRSSASAGIQVSANKGDLVKDFDRTISSEVVVALVDALTTDIRSRADRTYPLQHTCDRLSQLHDFLDRDHMTLNGLAWDEVIARVADRSATDLARCPEILEGLLTSLSETYRSKHDVTQGSVDDIAHHDYTSVANAAALGLFHGALRASVELGDAFQALKTFKSLQDFTDTNKKQALQGFFEKLTVPAPRSDTNPPTVNSESALGSPAPTYPAFFPSLPPTLLAGLLDLWSVAGLLDICSWMVHSNNVDGPLISNDMYSDPIVAPALLRFAIRSNDSSLIAKIKDSSPSLLEARTLISIAITQQELGNLSTATSVLQLLKGQLQHRWDLTQLASVMQALLPALMGKHGEASASEALSILSKLSHGDYGSTSGVEWLIAVLASVNDDMKALCSPWLGGFRTLDLDLSVRSFDVLLSGCVKMFGSRTGKALWKTWCDCAWREVKIGNGVEEATLEGSKPAVDAFRAADNQPTDLGQSSNHLLVLGRVRPKISTLRIIMRQAVEEAGTGPEPAAEETSREVLAWGEEIYAETFGLSPDRIARELSGYSSLPVSQTRRDSPYSKATTSVWKGVLAMKRSQKSRMIQALRSIEGEMRTFAKGDGGEQATFDALSRTERKFVHELALDLGLVAESVGREPKRGVAVSRVEGTPEIPTWTVEEWLRADT